MGSPRPGCVLAQFAHPRVRQDLSEMIVRPPQAVITAVSLGLICVALVLAIDLVAGTSGTGERLAIVLLAGCAVTGAVGLLPLARRRRAHAETILRNTIDSLGHGVATFAAGRLVASNSAFAELLALSPAEITAGRPVSDIERDEKAKTSSVLDDIAAQASRAEQARQPVAIERRRSDGTILELLYSPHRADGFTL